MAEREIILDTETTGLRPDEGHRVVEIGCIELVNYVPTGRVYHAYINPERPMPPEAFAVHGLSDDFLRDKIASNPNVVEFRRLCVERGMGTLREDGFAKVKLGKTTVEEVLSVTEATI